MTEFRPEILPAFPVHPGSDLREEIEARELSVENLAELTGRSLGELLAVVQERALIDQGLADDLACALGTSAEGWANGTALYLLTLERDYRRDGAMETIAAAD
jgi:plasmid maintenance system antidote protein VapI